MSNNKNKKINNIKNIFLQILIHFAIIFSVLALISVISGAIVGSNAIGSFFAWMIILLVSIILSIIFYFIFKINRISLFIQITIVYFLISIASYFVCFYVVLGLFNFTESKNIIFFVCSLGITLLGYGIIALIILLKSKRENDSLNESLASFKERDK